MHPPVQMRKWGQQECPFLSVVHALHFPQSSFRPVTQNRQRDFHYSVRDRRRQIFSCKHLAPGDNIYDVFDTQIR